MLSKRLIALTMVVILVASVLALVGCNSKQTSPEEVPQGPEGVKAKMAGGGGTQPGAPAKAPAGDTKADEKTDAGAEKGE